MYGGKNNVYHHFGTAIKWFLLIAQYPFGWHMYMYVSANCSIFFFLYDKKWIQTMTWYIYVAIIQSLLRLALACSQIWLKVFNGNVGWRVDIRYICFIYIVNLIQSPSLYLSCVSIQAILRFNENEKEWESACIDV